MRFSVITPNYNGARFLEETLLSVLAQKADVDLEYIVIDGNSTDGSLDIIDRYRADISKIVTEKDKGPAEAINKGLKMATGDVISWLNSDDIYYPGTLSRVANSFKKQADASMCFGRCKIINEDGEELRSAVTKFKECFFPISSHFTYQCINYISQPALFFRNDCVRKVGLLREDMVAAWDYEFILRLWHAGNAERIKGDPLSTFRWHDQSISGQNYRIQFKEEFDVARDDAGLLSLQTLVHLMVRYGIVSIYSIMELTRSFYVSKKGCKGQ